MRIPGFFQHRAVALGGITAIAILMLAGTLSAATGPGHYTRAQAASGAAVYSATCQQCHGVNLQGQSGPPLVGAAFHQYVGKSGTAASLFDFISKQMPADKPGSLTQQQYLDVTAFLLSRNGFPAGDVPLTKSTLADVPIGAGNVAAAPKGPKNAKSANNNEIVRAAAPQNTVFTKLPAGANVNVTDAMLAGADSDRANWLLPGRTWNNQRFSPLNQVNAGNVDQLVTRRARPNRDDRELRNDADRGKRRHVRHDADRQQQDENHRARRDQRRARSGTPPTAWARSRSAAAP